MNIEIQAQDHSGIWRTYVTVWNNSQRILEEMRQVKSMFPDYRVRAIDEDGRIVDILT